MPTLRRILKYTPAVVCGVLVLAWIASAFGSLTCTLQRGRIEGSIWFFWGNIGVAVCDTPLTDQTGVRFLAVPASTLHLLGFIDFTTELSLGDWYYGGRLPILLVLTGLLPLAIGPFLSFRFRLWHYLAYTALVAVELAYYLRWQG